MLFRSLHLHRVGNATAVADDGVLADDTRSDVYRGVSRRHDGTVAEARGTVDLAVILDHGIGNLLRVDDFHTVADGTPLRLREADLLVDEACQVVLELLVLEVLHHEGGQL